MTRKRRTASGVLALALAMTLAACGGSGGGSGNAAAQAQPTSEAGVNAKIDTSKVQKTLTVGVDNPYYLFHEDVFMAQKLGYFKEVGIDSVKIVQSEDPLPGLIGGSLDFILYDTDTAIAAAAKGTGIKYLSPYLGGEAHILAVGPGIKTVADLKGKTVSGGTFGSRTDMNMRNMLKDAGLDPDKDVQYVQTGGGSNEWLQAIIAGTIDAASLQLRHRTFLEAAGGKFLEEKVIQVPQVGWTESKKIAQNGSETSAAFLAATLKARKYIDDLAHKDDVIKTAQSKDFELPQEYQNAYKDENSPTYHTVDGGFEVADMDKFIQEQIDLEAVPKGTKWRDHADLTPLWRAQKHLGIPLRPTPDEL
jgi:ABC-type nitrate/sulfonate/bicarbonate transport system substrate-binding protein